MERSRRIVINKKRLTVVACATVLIVTVIGAFIYNQVSKAQTSKKYDSVVESAILALEESWVKAYDDVAPLFDDGMMRAGAEDRKLEIKGVRIIELDNEIIEEYQNVEYIVEFELYSNRYRTQPYLIQEDIYNSVLVYKDGSAKASLFNILRSYADNSEPDITMSLVKKVHELGDRYNRIIDLDREE